MIKCSLSTPGSIPPLLASFPYSIKGFSLMIFSKFLLKVLVLQRGYQLLFLQAFLVAYESLVTRNPYQLYFLKTHHMKSTRFILIMQKKGPLWGQRLRDLWHITATPLPILIPIKVLINYNLNKKNVKQRNKS